MKVRTASLLAAAVATAFMGLHVPAASAQRNNGTFVGTPQPRSANVPQRMNTPIPSSVILPMGNPIGPMSNPVAPIIPSPFIRYNGTTPTVVIPDQSGGHRGGYGQGNNYGRGRDRDVVYVPVPVPTSYYPYYPSYYYPEPLATPATIPGQLPGSLYSYPAPGMFNASPNEPAPAPAAPAASTFVYQQPQPEIYSEPRMIVNEPRPNRVIQPPVVGSTRADVIARLGQPWGTVLARGQETLYFDGLTVVLADSRVIQVR